MNKDISTPAFPGPFTKIIIPKDPDETGYTHTQHNPGMTLRDYFAAKTLPVLLQAAIALKKEPPSLRKIASDSYSMADLMMEVRNQ